MVHLLHRLYGVDAPAVFRLATGADLVNLATDGSTDYTRRHCDIAV